jgi:hypothetical protein
MIPHRRFVVPPLYFSASPAAQCRSTCCSWLRLGHSGNGGPCEEADFFTRGCRGSRRARMQGKPLRIRARRRRNKEGCLMAALVLGMVGEGSGAAARRSSFPVARSTKLGRLGCGVLSRGSTQIE